MATLDRRRIVVAAEVNEHRAEKVTHLLTWVLLLDVIGHYSLVQRYDRSAAGGAARCAGRVVRVVRLILRRVRRRRARGIPRRYTLLEEGRAGGATSPGSTAAAAAV